MRNFTKSSIPNFQTLTLSRRPSHEEISQLILLQPSPSKAIESFEWASQLPSFEHSPSTHHSLIQSLLSFNRLHQAHRHLLSTPTPLTSSILALIRAFARSQRPQSALSLLNLYSPQNPPPLTVLNAILNVLVETNIDDARIFFRKRMRAAHDDRTFGILMKGLCRAKRIAEAFKLLQLMKRSSSSLVRSNPVIYNILLHGLCRNGQVGRARSLMSEMPEVSDVTFHILISAYCREDNLVAGLVMLDKCFAAGFVPDKITVTKVVEVLCGHGRAMEAVELLERVERKGGVVDVVGYTSLVKGFCRNGKPEVGKRVLKEMERKGCLPNVHTYNALVSGFCESGRVDLAMDVFREMGMVGVASNFETFDCLIKGFCSDGRVEQGLKILDVMEEARGGRDNRVGPYNSVLYGFYRESRLGEAYEFLKRMEGLFPRVVGRSLRVLRFCEDGRVAEGKVIYDQMAKEGDAPSALVYVSLIEGLSAGGKNVREAFELLNEMVEKGYFPLVSTFNALIHGFCEGGNLISASKLLNEMVSRRCSPNAGSYNPLISVLCRKGETGRAYSYVVKMVEMGVVPDQLTWSYLFLDEKFDVASERAMQFLDALLQ